MDRAAALASLLKRGGSETTVAHAARTALDLLKTRAPDFCFVDVLLPDMATEEFLDQIRLLRPEALRVLLGTTENKRTAFQALISGLVHRHVLIPWDDADILLLIREGCLLRDELLRKNLDADVRPFTALPSPPRFHLQLRSLLRQRDPSVNEVVRAIEDSPALVAQLLRVANSVYYGARQPISSTSEAVMFVGTEYVISLIMAIEAFSSVCRTGGRIADPAIDILWNKSLRRAAVARIIAERWESPQNNGIAHIVALLMDIGYVVRAHQDPGRYRALTDASRVKGCTPHEIEGAFFAATHDVLGSALLRFWNTPEEIAGIVSHHHGPAGGNPYVLIAQLSDILESDSLGIPHDSLLDPRIPLWKERLKSELPPSVPPPGPP
jgi:HD-like signal output (HDOD) protein